MARRTAALILPQHGQASSGSRYPVTNVVIFTSRTCDHQPPARSAPSRVVPHREHSAGGGTSSRSSGSGSLRRSPGPIGSFDGGVPEIVLPEPSRRPRAQAPRATRRVTCLPNLVQGRRAAAAIAASTWASCPVGLN